MGRTGSPLETLLPVEADWGWPHWPVLSGLYGLSVKCGISISASGSVGVAVGSRGDCLVCWALEAARPACVLLVVGVSGTSRMSVSIGIGVVALIGEGCMMGLAVV